MVRFIPILLLSSHCLAGCSWNWNVLPDDSYSRTDKAAAGLSVACAGADAVTTNRGISRGLVETNPLLGDSPASGKVWAFTAASTYIINLVAKNMPTDYRKWWLGLLGAGQCGVALANELR